MERNIGVSCNVRQCKHNEGGMDLLQKPKNLVTSAKNHTLSRLRGWTILTKERKLLITLLKTFLPTKKILKAPLKNSTKY